MEQEKFNRATDIKDELRRLRHMQNDVNHLFRCREDNGICKQFWDDITRMLWNEYNFKEKIDTALFDFLFEYKGKIETEIGNLEDEFERL